MKRLYLSFLCFLISAILIARSGSFPDKDLIRSQGDSLEQIQKRTSMVAVTGAAAYSGMMSALYLFEYKNNLRPRLRISTLHEDWRMSMDEIHHITGCYQIGRIGFDLMQWAGHTEKHSAWAGGISGFFFISSQEMLDGFAADWKASSEDFAANALGSAMFISQQLLWHDQRIVPKWSYHVTSISDDYPDQFGKNLVQKMIKDYNGQTFWLSANLRSFIPFGFQIPLWLNIALGIGATGITGPDNTPPLYRSVQLQTTERRRLLFLAPDVDLTRIRTRSATLKWVFEAIGFLKFPLPAVEFNGQHLKLKPVYF